MARTQAGGAVRGAKGARGRASLTGESIGATEIFPTTRRHQQQSKRGVKRQVGQHCGGTVVPREDSAQKRARRSSTADTLRRGRRWRHPASRFPSFPATRLETKRCLPPPMAPKIPCHPLNPPRKRSPAYNRSSRPRTRQPSADPTLAAVSIGPVVPRQNAAVAPTSERDPPSRRLTILLHPSVLAILSLNSWFSRW